jgi:hypothetical protein
MAQPKPTMKTSVKLRNKAAKSAAISLASITAFCLLVAAASSLLVNDHIIAGWSALAIGLWILAIGFDRAFDAIGKAWRASDAAKTEQLRAVRPRL